MIKNIRQIAENNRYLLYEPKRDIEKYERNFSEVNVKEQIKRMGELEQIQNYINNGVKIYIVGFVLNEPNGEIQEIQTVHS